MELVLRAAQAPRAARAWTPARTPSSGTSTTTTAAPVPGDGAPDPDPDAEIIPDPCKRPSSSYMRFEADQPNESWQSDFTHYRLLAGGG